MLRKYEGMFLFDPAVTTDWEQVRAELDRLMDRIGARVIVSNKWDERRLAYEIRGRKRGVYALTYFEAEASKVAELERDATLSEAVLRCLVVRVDHLTEDEMKEIAARQPVESAPEGPRGDRPPFRGRDGREDRDGREGRDGRDRRDGRESREPRREKPADRVPAAGPDETPAEEKPAPDEAREPSGVVQAPGAGTTEE